MTAQAIAHDTVALKGAQGPVTTSYFYPCDVDSFLMISLYYFP